MEKELRNYIIAHQKEQLDLLGQLVLTSSYTYDRNGVNRVGDIISHHLAHMPLQRRKVKMKETGDHLVFSTPGAEKERYALLVGHMDTVFPPDSSFNGFTIDEKNVTALEL